MKTMFDALLAMSWLDLLALVCKFIKHSPSKYDLIESDALKHLEAEFSFFDIEIALPDIYKLLFNIDNQYKLNGEIESILGQLNKEVDSPNHPIFDDIELIQQVVSIALWKYEIEVIPSLVSFAKNFDRIDNESERRRIISGLDTWGH